MEFELSVKFNICKDFFYIVLVKEKVRKSLSRITKVVLGSSLLGFKAAKDLWAREAGYLVKILTLFFLSLKPLGISICWYFTFVIVT